VPEKSDMKLPVDYTKLDWRKGETRAVREQYEKDQKGCCYWCHSYLDEVPPDSIMKKNIDWSLFPKGFRMSPIHLQHNHDTGMTEGAVHMYCNAVMWQYHGR
jgi:hypothetical protein